jgi:hypothetical protein
MVVDRCSLTDKSATEAKICVTRVKWRRYVCYARDVLAPIIRFFCAIREFSPCPLPTTHGDLAHRRGEAVERLYGSLQSFVCRLLIS